MIAPEGVREAAVVVRGEKIVAVLPPDEIPSGCPVEEVGDRVVMPGLVDTHVHINEPGRTEWEGFETATRAAAAGGVTTLVDMPLNSSPVATTPDAFRQKLAAAAGKLWVDCGFYGGVVPGNADQLQPLIAAGVLGFKAFLCPSGIDEFPNATEADFRAVMPILARQGLPLLVHAEIPSSLTRVGAGPKVPPDPQSYNAYLESRPPAWEHHAIRFLIRLCEQYHCRVHIVHVSSADSLPLLAKPRAAGLRLTAETCPHYLCFAAEEIPDGDPRFKCAPPIRGKENRQRLWEGLRMNLIDTIGSDHSPAPPELKHLNSGDLQRAWGGIASLQLALPVVWTEARRRGFTLVDLGRWMSRRPAELVGLGGRKGAVAAGGDADLIVFDPEATFKVHPAMLHHRHKITPYEGRTLRGRVNKTFVRGRKVYEEGRFADAPNGQTLLSQAGS